MDEKEIRDLIGARIDALRSKDAAAAVACLAPDIIAFEVAGPLAMPAENVRDAEATQAWLDSFDGEIGVEIKDLVVHVSGDVGFAHSLNRLSGTRVDGQIVDIWLRSTLGFRRISGTWTIVHAHTSVPRG